MVGPTQGMISGTPKIGEPWRMIGPNDMPMIQVKRGQIPQAENKATMNTKLYVEKFRNGADQYMKWEKQ